MENNQASETSPVSNDLLDDEAIMLNEFVYASTGQRFLNFVIDNLLMNYGLSYLTAYMIGLIIGLINPEMLTGIRRDSFSFLLLAYAITITNYLIYYLIGEKLFNGYTLGKLITGTRAIRDDGANLSFRDVLLRTIIRFVPFEILSGFKIRPWHDDWSNTMVVKSR